MFSMLVLIALLATPTLAEKTKVDSASSSATNAFDVTERKQENHENAAKPTHEASNAPPVASDANVPKEGTTVNNPTQPAPSGLADNESTTRATEGAREPTEINGSKTTASSKPLAAPTGATSMDNAMAIANEAKRQPTTAPKRGTKIEALTRRLLNPQLAKEEEKRVAEETRRRRQEYIEQSGGIEALRKMRIEEKERAADAERQRVEAEKLAAEEEARRKVEEEAERNRKERQRIADEHKKIPFNHYEDENGIRRVRLPEQAAHSFLPGANIAKGTVIRSPVYNGVVANKLQNFNRQPELDDAEKRKVVVAEERLRLENERRARKRFSTGMDPIAALLTAQKPQTQTRGVDGAPLSARDAALERLGQGGTNVAQTSAADRRKRISPALHATVGRFNALAANGKLPPASDQGTTTKSGGR